jgi:hypothetical protein
MLKYFALMNKKCFDILLYAVFFKYNDTKSQEINRCKNVF